MAPPIWNEVWTRPAARPCSWSETPEAAWTLSDEYVHQPSEPLPVPMLAVCGADDPFVEATDLPLWGEHTAALFRTAEVGAGHWSLAADAAGALAAEVRSALAAARAG